MPESPAVCGHCRAGLRISSLNTDNKISCPGCYEPAYAYVYPAWFKEEQAATKGTYAAEDQASCFYHDTNLAESECSSCGKLICKVCELNYGVKVFCPDCIAKGLEKGGTFQQSAKRYDTLALLLSLAPFTLLLWFVAPVTAPLAIYFSTRYWSKKETLVPYNRWRYVVATVISLLTLAFLGFGIFEIVTEIGELPEPYQPE